MLEIRTIVCYILLRESRINKKGARAMGLQVVILVDNAM